MEPDPVVEAARRATERAERETGMRRARNLWAETVPIRGTLGECYLRARACAHTVLQCPALRFHPRCWHPTATRLPAMVAAVTLGPGLVAAHRTYLAEPGRKAPVKPQKAMLGPVFGGAVRLSDGSGPLVMAKGIETALSLLDALSDTSPRVWAALSAAGMAGLRLPGGLPGELVLAPDRDANGTGQRAADTLARRVNTLGWRVRIMEPPAVGRDWNDVAMEAVHERA